MILELLLGALINSNTRKTVTTSLGGHMKACVFCDQLQPHELIEIKKKDAISITSLDGYSQKHASQCEVCHKQTIYTNGIIPAHIERWMPHSNFHDYARRSGHPSVEANLNVKTPQSIGALLKSVTSRSEKTTAMTPRDYLLLGAAFILSILLSVIVFGISASSAGASDFDVYLLLGIPFIGFFLGVFLVSLNKRKTTQITQLEDFKDRMMRLGIKPDDILATMPQSLLQNRKIYALVKPMMHGSH